MKRLPAIDWMRGLAMVLMALDHAGGAFNPARPATDSVYFYDVTVPLDPLEFAVRFVSHLCAPTFLFLAGTSLALSIARKRERGLSEGAIDRDLFVRGAIVLAVDLLVINWFWAPGLLLLQVMYAIGGSMMLMSVLRRVPVGWLVGGALVVLVGFEPLLVHTLVVPMEPGPIAVAFLLGVGLVPVQLGSWTGIVAVYPLLPWCAMLVLGWVFGLRLARKAERSPVPLLGACGLVGIALYALVRACNGYGNAGMLRLDGSWVQWLHVSKYPPSISYTALTLGAMALILAAMFRAQERRSGPVNARGPMLVLGQTAFFFYVAHIVLLELSAHALGLHQAATLSAQLTAWLAVLVLLYPACLAYRAAKSRRPQSPLRYF